MMATSPIYVPVLKGKEGEFAALEALFSDVRRQVMPLIEVPPIPYDYVNERPAKSLEDHVAGIAQRLQQCWPKSPLYLDFPWFEEDERLSDGRVALDAVLKDCLELKVEAVPVVSRSSSGDYISAASQYANSKSSPVCFRLVVKDFEEDVDLDGEVERILKLLRVEPTSIDLVLDLEDLGSDASRAVLVARSIFSVIPRKDDWRRIILVGASFPEDLSDVDASTVSRLPRQEWQLWKTLQRRPERLPRSMIFGDYAISHQVPRELDPRTMRMSASIRYTTPDEWLVVKGRNVRQYGFDQYFTLSKALVERPEFSGRTFSWGDAFIADCADGMEGPGNATTWRKVGTNHHITLVTRELANPRAV